MTMDSFIQRLAMLLISWEVTSFIIGESAEQEQRNPVFTVADGVFWLSQAADRNSVVRKLQAVKVRGRASMPGLHTFRITRAWSSGVPAHSGTTGRDGARPRRSDSRAGSPVSMR